MRLAITYNLKKDVCAALPPDFYAEWDDLSTIRAVEAALREDCEEVILVEADADCYEKLRAARPDLVFNMAEGLAGESREAHIPAILELLAIPYTGSGPLTLALCLNKARAKEILSCHGISTPKYFTTKDATPPKGNPPGFPLIVKPLYEGSSKGIRNDSIVYDMDSLKEKVSRVASDYAQPALVEEFLCGREFTVALLGNHPDITVLPIVEINYSSFPEGASPIYSYEAKWVFDRRDAPLDVFVCPADIPETLAGEIRDIARRAFLALDVRDWCRIDVRLDSEGNPNVLELNPLPGILPDPKDNSCFPKAARAAGIEFAALVRRVVAIALRRCEQGVNPHGHR